MYRENDRHGFGQITYKREKKNSLWVEEDGARVIGFWNADKLHGPVWRLYPRGSKHYRGEKNSDGPHVTFSWFLRGLLLKESEYFVFDSQPEQHEIVLSYLEKLELITKEITLENLEQQEARFHSLAAVLSTAMLHLANGFNRVAVSDVELANRLRTFSEKSKMWVTRGVTSDGDVALDKLNTLTNQSNLPSFALQQVDAKSPDRLIVQKSNTLQRTPKAVTTPATTGSRRTRRSSQFEEISAVKIGFTEAPFATPLSQTSKRLVAPALNVDTFDSNLLWESKNKKTETLSLKVVTDDVKNSINITNKSPNNVLERKENLNSALATPKTKSQMKQLRSVQLQSVKSQPRKKAMVNALNLSKSTSSAIIKKRKRGRPRKKNLSPIAKKIDHLNISRNPSPISPAKTNIDCVCPVKKTAKITSTPNDKLSKMHSPVFKSPSRFTISTKLSATSSKNQSSNHNLAADEKFLLAQARAKEIDTYDADSRQIDDCVNEAMAQLRYQRLSQFQKAGKTIQHDVHPVSLLGLAPSTVASNNRYNDCSFGKSGRKVMTIANHCDRDLMEARQILQTQEYSKMVVYLNIFDARGSEQI